MHPWVTELIVREQLALRLEQAERRRLARAVQDRRTAWAVRSLVALIGGRLARPTAPGCAAQGLAADDRTPISLIRPADAR